LTEAACAASTNAKAPRNLFVVPSETHEEKTMYATSFPGRPKEPKLEDLLSDPILDILLAYDRLSREDLSRAIEAARKALARVPRQWQVERQEVAPHTCRPREVESRALAICCL
jgi:hypothetical protein